MATACSSPNLPRPLLKFRSPRASHSRKLLKTGYLLPPYPRSTGELSRGLKILRHAHTYTPPPRSFLIYFGTTYHQRYRLPVGGFKMTSNSTHTIWLSYGRYVNLVSVAHPIRLTLSTQFRKHALEFGDYLCTQYYSNGCLCLGTFGNTGCRH